MSIALMERTLAKANASAPKADPKPSGPTNWPTSAVQNTTSLNSNYSNSSSNQRNRSSSGNQQSNNVAELLGNLFAIQGNKHSNAMSPSNYYTSNLLEKRWHNEGQPTNRELLGYKTNLNNIESLAYLSRSLNAGKRQEQSNRDNEREKGLYDQLQKTSLERLNDYLVPRDQRVLPTAGTGSMEWADRMGGMSGGNWGVYDTKLQDYKVGDVISFYKPEWEKHIVHRIVDITPQGYITQGDNNANPDPGYVTSNMVYGKMTSQVPWGVFPFFRDQAEKTLQEKYPGYDYQGVNAPHYNIDTNWWRNWTGGS